MRSIKVSLREFILYMLIAGLLAIGGRWVTLSSAPIVVLMHAETITQTENLVIARVTGWKGLSCEFLGHTAKVDFTDHPDGHEWQPANFRFMDTDTYSSKPIGRHDFGFWEWDVVVPKAASRVMLIAEHNCSGYFRQTPLIFNL